MHTSETRLVARVIVLNASALGVLWRYAKAARICQRTYERDALLGRT